MQSKLFSLDGFLEFAFLLLYIIIWKMGFLFRLLTQGFHRVQKYAIRWKSLPLCIAIGCIEEPLMSPEKNVFLNFETRRNMSLMHVIICGNKVWPSCTTVAAQSMKFHVSYLARVTKKLSPMSAHHISLSWDAISWMIIIILLITWRIGELIKENKYIF